MKKSRFSPNENGDSYRRQFWVGLKEKNTPEGQKAVAERIKAIFDDLKQKDTFSEVFDGNEAIDLTDRGLAIIAGELAKYSFLDASVDVKGMAYENHCLKYIEARGGDNSLPRVTSSRPWWE